MVTALCSFQLTEIKKMFPYLDSQGKDITDKRKIDAIFKSLAFKDFLNVNIMPLIYNEGIKECNIMIFDHEKAMRETARIIYIGKGERFGGRSQGKGRKHPIFMFLDKDDNYICEVRYGGASANALQRGLWTHTRNAVRFF